MRAIDIELDDFMCAERLDQFRRRAQCDDLAVIHDRDAIAESRGFFHVVRGHQHGASARAKLLDHFPEVESRLWIETGGRLIEEENVGIVDQRASDAESLLLTTRQAANAVVAFSSSETSAMTSETEGPRR